jgi:hypothetical protein
MEQLSKVSQISRVRMLALTEELVPCVKVQVSLGTVLLLVLPF